VPRVPRTPDGTDGTPPQGSAGRHAGFLERVVLCQTKNGLAPCRARPNGTLRRTGEPLVRALRADGPRADARDRRDLDRPACPALIFFSHCMRLRVPLR
jgi:hypothetical protein